MPNAKVTQLRALPPRAALIIETVVRSAQFLEDMPVRGRDRRECVADHVARLREVVRQLREEFAR
jgi:hypothetical protein